MLFVTHFGPVPYENLMPFGTFLIVAARCPVCGEAVCLDRSTYQENYDCRLCTPCHPCTPIGTAIHFGVLLEIWIKYGSFGFQGQECGTVVDSNPLRIPSHHQSSTHSSRRRHCMWQRIRGHVSQPRWSIMTTNARGRRPRAHQPFPEILEDRQLLTASLAPIASFSVPAQLGYQLPLDGSDSTSSDQTFNATSSNPDIKVSVAQGQFWTVTVSHTAANSSDVTINHETMTFQLFGDLTPQTVARITTLTEDGYYTNGFPSQTPPVLAGQYIPRITSVAFSGFSVVQGGSSSATSTTSSSGLPPIATEPVQQLAFTGQYQIAMANTGAPNSTDAQFFITNGVLSQSAQQAFDFNYTIFGQLVSGQQTVTDLSKVAVQNNSSGEDSEPIRPVVINSVALSSTNPNGVLHIDTTSATAGQTATITVTATDPTNDTTATQSFTVTVGAYNGPTNSVTSSITANTPQTIQLKSTP